jgi:hypothetical protein
MTVAFWAITAHPDTVFAYLADPSHLPARAPTFAEGVRRDGDARLVDSGGRTRRYSIRASAEYRTVDITPVADPQFGLFTRVVPDGGGCSTCIFAVSLPPGTPQQAVDDQMAAVVDELRRVRERVTAGAQR